MRCTEELLSRIKEAIESVSFGSVEITLAESGEFVEIRITKKVRIFKDKRNSSEGY